MLIFLAYFGMMTFYESPRIKVKINNGTKQDTDLTLRKGGKEDDGWGHYSPDKFFVRRNITTTTTTTVDPSY